MRKQNLLQMWVVAFFALLAATFSCSRVNTEEVETSTPPVRAQVLDINENEGVLPGDIAGLLAVEYKGTKSEGREVKEIIPILSEDSGSEGDTLMFAVNYKDNKGFTLISATRNYYPILAEAPEGNYREDDDNPGFAMWLDETKAVVAHQRSTPDSIAKYRSAWLRYAGTRDLELTATKGGDVSGLVNNSIGQWQSQGYDVVMLSNFMGSSSYDQSLKNNVSQAANQYANHSYNPSQYVFVLVRSNINSITTGPLLATNWHQLDPYNNARPSAPVTPNNQSGRQPAGCVNIAVGQIMKDYQYPTYFNWSQIDTYGTDIASFLNTLYAATNSYFSNGETSSTLYDAKSALLGYGYSNQMSVISYNASQIQSNITRSRPVIIGGTNSSGRGHAWVCDGYRSSSISRDYTVMALEDCPDYLTPTRYNSIYSSSDITSVSAIDHHMNWGRNTYSDMANGWLIENSDIGYNQGKQMLVNIFY